MSQRDVNRVLDASALLAWLREEPGAEDVDRALDGARISAVNLSEVLQKSLAAGLTSAETSPLPEDLGTLGLSVVAFGTREAGVAAELWSVARSLGLSLADRACLATAICLESPAMTADRGWEGIEWEGLSVELIR
ncbi:MAG: type II toxin-antitoxin system VapC family toxin [Actinomycetota bacterium]|nr:type II toxin-antitoxin system VapC family toxin [Actinomycetota bacterium]